MKSRFYTDPCGVARALDRVGERWALLVVRELLLGPKRFADLREGLPRVSPNVLSQRLDELASSGVVARKRLAPPARAWVYELTPWGRELDDALLALARWGGRAAPVPAGEPSADALLLALRTTLAPDGGDPLRVDLVLDGQRYRLRIAEGLLEVARRAGDGAEASITTDTRTLRRLVYAELAIADARASGALRIEGSSRAATRFLRSFRAPVPVARRRAMKLRTFSK